MLHNQFVENLYNNNVIFSYYGFIDTSVISQVIEITKSKLKTNNEPDTVIKKVVDAINECAGNIVKHNFYDDDSKVSYKSLLVVSKPGEFYQIDAINVINAEQKIKISEQLDYLHSRTKEELLELKSKIVSNTATMIIVHSGLVDLVLKADSCDCNFKEMEEHALLNISYRINTLN